MTTIIRRYRRRHHGRRLAGIGTIILITALAAWLFMVIWAKGGPQPVHDIVIAVPAPQIAPATGRRA